MSIKIQIARFLIIVGFLLSVSSYAIQLIDFYCGHHEDTSIVLEEPTESSEKKENDSSEKEDIQEKDKISQYNEVASSSHINTRIINHPEFYVHTSTVYLEYTTPPPKQLFL